MAVVTLWGSGNVGHHAINPCPPGVSLMVEAFRNPCSLFSCLFYPSDITNQLGKEQGHPIELEATRHHHCAQCFLHSASGNPEFGAGLLGFGFFFPLFGLISASGGAQLGKGKGFTPQPTGTHLVGGRLLDTAAMQLQKHL